MRNASLLCLPGNHFLTNERISATLYYFPEAEMSGDIDNIVKPILDAFTRRVYFDDKQVERILVQKFEPDRVFVFASPSEGLQRAMDGRKPLIYIRLSGNPHEDLI